MPRLSGREGSTPTSGCGKSVAASCFLFQCFLFTPLAHLGLIPSWHHVPSSLCMWDEMTSSMSVFNTQIQDVLLPMCIVAKTNAKLNDHSKAPLVLVLLFVSVKRDTLT